MVEPGALELIPGKNGMALVTTTEHSGDLSRNHFATKVPRELAQDFSSDNKQRVIAAVLNGPYHSAFAAPPEGLEPTKHIGQSIGSGGAVFAIADVDWLFDPFSLQESNVDGQVIVRPLNDNLAFLLNIIEYASGDAALISIRSRGNLKRPFTRVAKLFQAAELKYKEQEAALIKQVSEIEKRIALHSKMDDSEKTGPLHEQAETRLSEFRAELLPARRALRSVRRQIKDEVDGLGRLLTLTNLIAGPVLVLMWGLGITAWRRRRRYH